MKVKRFFLLGFVTAAGLVLCGLVLLLLSQAQTVGQVWYVTSSGSDANDCASASLPCTLNGALVKASDGDTIYIASGTYTGSSGSEVVTVTKSITLSGGWDTLFISRTGFSIVDGRNMRRGLSVGNGVTLNVEYFDFQNGQAANGGGIDVGGTLRLRHSLVRNNNASSNGGGIYMRGQHLDIRGCSIISNGAWNGGGIRKFLGTVALVNSTVSGNQAHNGGGISNGNPGAINIDYSTITNNSCDYSSGGGIGNYYPNMVILRSSILAQNAPADCQDQLTSAGNNLIGTLVGCSYFSPQASDIVGSDPQLDTLQFTEQTFVHPLLSGSPAIDTGYPGDCTDYSGQLQREDQRGYIRMVDGDDSGVARCDIGAYEYNSWLRPNTAITLTSHLPDPSIIGDVITVTYEVSPTSSSPISDLSGEVAILANENTVCTQSLLLASVCPFTLNTAGVYTLTARYGGDYYFNDSESSPSLHTVFERIYEWIYLPLIVK